MVDGKKHQRKEFEVVVDDGENQPAGVRTRDQPVSVGSVTAPSFRQFAGSKKGIMNSMIHGSHIPGHSWAGKEDATGRS